MTSGEHTERNKATVASFFEGPGDLDRLTLMSEDCEWWNGIGEFPAAPGQTVFRGHDEIGRVILGREAPPKLRKGTRGDRYDLSTARFHEVIAIADGDYVFRQHRYTATTMRGRAYENHYGFLFRFTADGLIERIWEHWGTLAAYRQLSAGSVAVHDLDEVLVTTPSVRKRLDLDRPVERDLIEECLDLAVHAPNGSNQQPYRFVFVDVPERKRQIAEIYRGAMSRFQTRARKDVAEDHIDRTTPQQQRIAESVFYLRDHLDEVPVLCIPLVAGRTDGGGPGAEAERTGVFWQANRWGSVIPALWSFMLALRSRGLGSAWTTLTLLEEQAIADILDIPYEKWMQVGLFPIAYTDTLEFQPTPRKPAADVIRWNGYRGAEATEAS